MSIPHPITDITQIADIKSRFGTGGLDTWVARYRDLVHASNVASG